MYHLFILPLSICLPCSSPSLFFSLIRHFFSFSSHIFFKGKVWNSSTKFMFDRFLQREGRERGMVLLILIGTINSLWFLDETFQIIDFDSLLQTPADYARSEGHQEVANTVDNFQVRSCVDFEDGFIQLCLNESIFY